MDAYDAAAVAEAAAEAVRTVCVVDEKVEDDEQDSGSD